MALSTMSVMSVIVCMPFYTLLERKVLGYIQLRKGPKKVGFIGLLQPITDGVKLMLKEGTYPLSVKGLVYWLCPFVSFLLMLFTWLLYPHPFLPFSLPFSVLLFLCWSSVGVYTILGSGWASNAKFSFLGAVRGASQSVSYEMVLLTMIFFPLFFMKGYSLGSYSTSSSGTLVNFCLVPMFLFIMVCETKRAPLDFAEGESELVSGFNTEYGSLSFTFLFLGEYGNMLFSSALLSVMFLPKSAYFSPLLVGMVSLFFLYLRGAYPRYRYDLLMQFSWKVVLPVSLSFIFVYLFL